MYKIEIYINPLDQNINKDSDIEIYFIKTGI